MKKIVLFLIVLFVTYQCIGQVVDDQEPDTTTYITLDLFQITLVLEDEFLKEPDGDVKLIYKDSFFYHEEDSSLYNGPLCINLTIDLINDIGLNYEYYGSLEGSVKNGTQGGVWTLKDIRKLNAYENHVLKQLSYKNGLLDGDYFVYSTEPKIFCDSIVYWADSTKYLYTTKGEILSSRTNKEVNAIEPTSHFENGTGLYLDYYNETGVLKEKGYLKYGKKDGRWLFYDTLGNIIKVEIYQNGLCITE